MVGLFVGFRENLPSPFSKNAFPPFVPFPSGDPFPDPLPLLPLCFLQSFRYAYPFPIPFPPTCPTSDPEPWWIVPPRTLLLCAAALPMAADKGFSGPTPTPRGLMLSTMAPVLGASSSPQIFTSKPSPLVVRTSKLSISRRASRGAVTSLSLVRTAAAVAAIALSSVIVLWTEYDLIVLLLLLLFSFASLLVFVGTSPIVAGCNGELQGMILLTA
mmetsp:Transcript_12227/g.29027  ORF Transcript_12227/g.29027 Transcript_12227/m.29027 type:complete len:215 (-) Transcript_12227:109-753(-)